MTKTHEKNIATVENINSNNFIKNILIILLNGLGDEIKNILNNQPKPSLFTFLKVKYNKLYYITCRMLNHQLSFQ
jgi:hypothetical protein